MCIRDSNKETVGNALDKLTYKGEGNNMVVDTDALFGLKEKDSYPLFLTTYELVCSKYQDSSTGDRVRDFLTVAINDGQDSNLEDQGYIPVTGQLKNKLTSAIKEIK